MKFTAAILLALSTQAAAFAPAAHNAARVETALAAEQSRTKKVLKRVGKVAGAVGAVALATTAAPGAAVAGTAEIVQKVKDSQKLVGGVFALGALAGLVGSKVTSAPTASKAVSDKVGKVYPGSIPNKQLVAKVSDVLKTKGYGKDSLVATSLCCDEVSRVLEQDFANIYTDNFSMGGLAGFPFVGTVGFGAMASHIPDGGSCLVVYGPHVGVDSKGVVGTTERRGRVNGGACCGSAIAASNMVAGALKGEPLPKFPPTEALDAEQAFVSTMLMPHAERLEKAGDDKMTELPYALYDAQKEMMSTIIKDGAGAVGGDGKIAVLGGIQINTPPGESDYYLPLSFELFDNTGKKLEDLALA